MMCTPRTTRRDVDNDRRGGFTLQQLRTQIDELKRFPSLEIAPYVTMSQEKSPVVASLRNRSAHPYSSVALSATRSTAVAAGKDTLTVLAVRPTGLSEINSFRVSQVSLKMYFDHVFVMAPQLIVSPLL